MATGLRMTIFFGISWFALLGAFGLAFFFCKFTGSKWLFALVLVAFVVTRGSLVIVEEKPASSGVRTIGFSGE